MSQRRVILGAAVPLVRVLAPVLALAASVSCHDATSPAAEAEEEDDGDRLRGAEGACGVARWAVKTGTDGTAGAIDPTPVDQTVAGLGALARPGSVPSASRVVPEEATTFRLRDVTLTAFKQETDSDYHIVAQQGGSTMIVEIPAPSCVGSSSPLAAAIAAARATFDASFTATGSFQHPNVTFSVEGVGFFDAMHGQTGVAPNGFELHPVVGLCFGAGCALPDDGSGPPPDLTDVPPDMAAPAPDLTTPPPPDDLSVDPPPPDDLTAPPSPDDLTPPAPADFWLSSTPMSHTLHRGASVSYAVQIDVTAGDPVPVDLSTGALPSGVSASFDPSTAWSGSTATLTLSATSSAPLVTSRSVTIAGDGAGRHHYMSVKVTVAP